MHDMKLQKQIVPMSPFYREIQMRVSPSFDVQQLFPGQLFQMQVITHQTSAMNEGWVCSHGGFLKLSFSYWQISFKNAYLNSNSSKWHIEGRKEELCISGTAHLTHHCVSKAVMASSGSHHFQKSQLPKTKKSFTFKTRVQVLPDSFRKGRFSWACPELIKSLLQIPCLSNALISGRI